MKCIGPLKSFVIFNYIGDDLGSVPLLLFHWGDTSPHPHPVSAPMVSTNVKLTSFYDIYLCHVTIVVLGKVMDIYESPFYCRFAYVSLTLRLSVHCAECEPSISVSSCIEAPLTMTFLSFIGLLS